MRRLFKRLSIRRAKCAKYLRTIAALNEALALEVDRGERLRAELLDARKLMVAQLAVADRAAHMLLDKLEDENRRLLLSLGQGVPSDTIWH